MSVSLASVATFHAFHATVMFKEKLSYWVTHEYDVQPQQFCGGCENEGVGSGKGTQLTKRRLNFRHQSKKEAKRSEETSGGGDSFKRHDSPVVPVRPV